MQGSCAAWGRFFPEFRLFGGEATCLGQLHCLGQNFFQNSSIFYKPLIWGSCVTWCRIVSQNQTFFEQATCPGQLRCLGQNFFSEISLCWKQPLVRGSCAAGGRTFSQKSICFARNNLSGAAALPVADLFLRNLSFLGRNNLSRAAALLGAELLL